MPRTAGSEIGTANDEFCLDSGAIIELRKHDILGHEVAGRIVEVGPAVKNLKIGDKVVSGFNMYAHSLSSSPSPEHVDQLRPPHSACGECFMCQKKLSSACVMTNSSSTMQTMYGGRTCTCSLFRRTRSEKI